MAAAPPRHVGDVIKILSSDSSLLAAHRQDAADAEHPIEISDDDYSIFDEEGSNPSQPPDFDYK